MRLCMSLPFVKFGVKKAAGITIKNLTFSSHPHWLGCKDREVEGIFRWLDGTLSAWNNWDVGDGEPDGEQDQNCLLLKTSNKKWFDHECDDEQRYLCMSTPSKLSRPWIPMRAVSAFWPWKDSTRSVMRKAMGTISIAWKPILDGYCIKGDSPTNQFYLKFCEVLLFHNSRYSCLIIFHSARQELCSCPR